MAVDLGPYSDNEGTPQSKEDLPPQPSLPCVLANPNLKDEDVQNEVNQKRDLRALQTLAPTIRASSVGIAVLLKHPGNATRLPGCSMSVRQTLS